MFITLRSVRAVALMKASTVWIWFYVTLHGAEIRAGAAPAFACFKCYSSKRHLQTPFKQMKKHSRLNSSQLISVRKPHVLTSCKYSSS